MMTVLEAIAAALIKWLAGWIEGRKAQRAVVVQQQAQASATRGAEAAQVEVEQARRANEADVDRVRSDADRPDGLQQQSIDVNDAIDKANGVVR